MGKVDPNEAPTGYVAVESEGCHGCAFKAVGLTVCQEKTPCGVHRKDGCYVIFIKKPDDVKAAASWPYDSEGTPVEVNHA